MSEAYAQRIFSGLEKGLPRQVVLSPRIADFKDDAGAKAVQIRNVCAGAGIKDLLLGGWCNGGIEAIRIAQKLNNAELNLRPIVLFDTYETAYYSRYGESPAVGVKESLTIFYQQLFPEDQYDIWSRIWRVDFDAGRHHYGIAHENAFTAPERRKHVRYAPD